MSSVYINILMTLGFAVWGKTAIEYPKVPLILLVRRFKILVKENELNATNLGKDDT